VTSTSASNAGLIVALTIVITPLLQRFAGGDRIPPTFYGAGAVAVLGCVLLTQSCGFSAPGIGDTLVAVAALLRAVHVTVIARVSAGRQLDSARTTLVQLVFVAVTSAGFAHVFGSPATTFAATMSLADWALTGYLAVACTVFAFVVQMWAVRCTSPARVSLLLGTEPVWAVLVGVGLAGDPVTGIGLVGAALVLTGTNWGRSTLTRFQLQVGVAACQAHGHVGDQRVEEPFPVDRVNACAHGEVQAGQHGHEKRNVHNGLGYRHMDAEPCSRAGRFTDRAGFLGGPQHGHVVGHRDDPEREEERKQPRGEEHHLNCLRHHHHCDDVDLLGQ
jgi:hypothetical protein